MMIRASNTLIEAGPSSGDMGICLSALKIGKDNCTTKKGG